PRAATFIPGFHAQDRRACFPECAATAIDDFLADPSSLRKCMAGKNAGSGRVRAITVYTLKLILQEKRYEHSSIDQPSGTEFRRQHRLESRRALLVWGNSHRPIDVRLCRGIFLQPYSAARRFPRMEDIEWLHPRSD